MVKPGYKQTEIGVIPEDWEVSTLKDTGILLSGDSPSKLPDGKIPYFKVDQLNNTNKYQKETPYHVSVSNPIISGSIIFPKRGAAIGTNKIRILLQDSFVDTNIMALTITDEDTCSEYIYYCLLQKGLDEIADTTSIPQINNKHVYPLKFPKPPIIEQRYIAKALSDMDDLISSLEKLVEKKKAIKQGAMQELLTGKRRLPGFGGKWTRQTMDAYVDFLVGYPFSSSYFNEKSDGLRLIRNRDLKSDDQIIYSNETVNPLYVVENGDVLVGMDGDFLPCVWGKGRALLNQRVGKLLFSDSIHNRFAYYAFQKPLTELQDGTGATTVKHLSHGDIKKLSVLMPPSKYEQEAVASVLIGIDKEIQVYEDRRRKACHIKQGMMQQLLTGNIRFL